MNRYPELDRWLGALLDAGIDLDPLEIADAFWLARVLPGAKRDDPDVSFSTPPHSKSDPPEPQSSDAAAPPVESGTAARAGPAPSPPAEYRVLAQAEPGAAAQPIVIPDAPALYHKLELARALRPLRRRIDSYRTQELDEVATAHRMAVLRYSWAFAPLVPVLRPGRARWLDLVMVVDRSQTMAVWRRTLDELRTLLYQLGAFEQVRVVYVQADPDAPDQLLTSARADAEAWPVLQGTEFGMHGRSLVMVVSDCIGPLWTSGAMSRFLEQQAKRGPLAVLQVLSPHLWRRTSLAGLEPALLRATAPGAPPHRLQIESEDEELPHDEADPRFIVPVVPLLAGGLAAWSHLVAGHPAGVAAGFWFEPRPPDVTGAPPRAAPEEPETEGLVDRFLRASSTTARKLAAYLAAVPLTMPVLRYVRMLFVPEAREDHLVEVLFSGLLVQRRPDLWTIADEAEAYDFRPGARELLLSGLGSTTIEHVSRRIGAALGTSHGADPDFSAFLVAAEDASASQARPFATVTRALAAVLRPVRSMPPAEEGRLVTAPPVDIAVVPRSAGEQVVDTGRWFLVDGTDSVLLPAHQRELSSLLGRELAARGHKLLTLGTNGVAYHVAEGFFSELGRRGYPSGRSRMSHVVHEGSEPRFRHGRFIYAGPGQAIVRAATTRADVVLLIGGSDYADDLVNAATQENLPLEWLIDREDRASDLGTSQQRTWHPERFEPFIAQALQLVGAGLLAPPLIAGLPPELAHAAAVALDEFELADYQVRVPALRLGVSRLSSDTVEMLFIDGRASHRLLGYLSGQQVSPLLLLTALEAEREAIWVEWQTRTLWLALSRLRDCRAPESEAESHALAALCQSISMSLASNAYIDRGHHCKELLGALRAEAPPTLRARELARWAARYTLTREQSERSDERTARLTDIVEEIRHHAIRDQALEARIWFEGHSSGERIVSLGLLLGSSAPGAFGLVERAIARPSSAFEQYTTLRVAKAMLDALSPAQRDRLRVVLEAQRTGPDATITRDHVDRWALSTVLLEQLSEITPRPGPLAFERGLSVHIGVSHAGAAIVQGGAGDAQRLAAAFLAVGYAPSDVWVLIEATEADVRRALAASERLGGRGTVVVSFSGTAVANASGLRLALADSTWIHVNEILDAIPRDHDLVLILDCSSAGAAAPSAMTQRDPERGIAILAACGKDQLTFERRIDGETQGIFSSAIVRVLTRAGREIDNVISVRWLFDQVSLEHDRLLPPRGPGMVSAPRPELFIYHVGDFALARATGGQVPPPTASILDRARDRLHVEALLLALPLSYLDDLLARAAVEDVIPGRILATHDVLREHLASRRGEFRDREMEGQTKLLQQNLGWLLEFHDFMYEDPLGDFRFRHDGSERTKQAHREFRVAVETLSTRLGAFVEYIRRAYPELDLKTFDAQAVHIAERQTREAILRSSGSLAQVDLLKNGTMTSGARFEAKWLAINRGTTTCEITNVQFDLETTAAYRAYLATHGMGPAGTFRATFPQEPNLARLLAPGESVELPLRSTGEIVRALLRRAQARLPDGFSVDWIIVIVRCTVRDPNGVAVELSDSLRLA